MINTDFIQPLFSSFADTWQATISSLATIALKIEEPVCEIIDGTKVEKEYNDKRVIAVTSFAGPVPGMSLLLMPLPMGIAIPERIINPGSQQVPDKFTDLHASAFQEACGQVWGTVNEKFSRTLGRRFKSEVALVILAAPAQYIKELPALNGIEEYLRIKYPMDAGPLGYCMVEQLFPLSFIEQAIPETVIKEEIKTEKQTPAPPKKKASRKPLEQLKIPQVQKAEVKKQRTSAQQKIFQSAPENIRRNLDVMMGIPVEVIIELGKTRVPAENILGLSAGSIVELDAMADKPIRITVADQLIARGQVVSIGDKFGVRVTELVTPKQRIMEK